MKFCKIKSHQVSPEFEKKKKERETIIKLKERLGFTSALDLSGDVDELLLRARFLLLVALVDSAKREAWEVEMEVARCRLQETE